MTLKSLGYPFRRLLGSHIIKLKYRRKVDSVKSILLIGGVAGFFSLSEILMERASLCLALSP